MLSENAAGYAGDVTPEICLRSIMDHSKARMIDVRTTAEWAYVGQPDPASLGHQPIRLEWQVFPHMSVDGAFVEKLAGILKAEGLDDSSPLYFLCRSGVRSKAAAIAMSAAGFSRCYNISGGFEGPLGADGHRGAMAGWKAAGLPWTQP